MRLWLIRCLATCLFLAFHGHAPAQDVVRVGGTGAGLGALKELAKAYERLHGNQHISILPSIGSTGGIRAVLDGKLELSCSSRPLLEAERLLGAVELPFASTAFVFATQPATPAEALTLRDIEDIYAGRRTRWKNGQPIRLILRPKSDSAHGLLSAMTPGMAAALDQAHALPGVQVGITDQEALTRLEKTPGSFGTTVLGLIVCEGRQARPLAVEGVLPTEPGYPYALTLNLIHRSGGLSPATQGFLGFTFSKKGRAILSQMGYKPRPPAEPGKGR